ncbi:MAG TPA: sigma-70 family RNA polymerase sigma factor [Rhodothermales bacterium]|nr:sigma-70 family RNA polymerase sigma factor [Rhodothermales bacterium]
MHPLDPQAVARARSGDAVARERLLAALMPALRGFFRARIGARPEVDDLVQNALLRVHRGLEHLQQDDRLKAFAMKAALYELQDHYRGRYAARETLYDPERPPLDEGTRPGEQVSMRYDLERALATLTPHARQIIELREMGYPYLDIAETLGTTEAAVKMQVKRAFERLRTMLDAAVLVAVFLPTALFAR